MRRIFTLFALVVVTTIFFSCQNMQGNKKQNSTGLSGDLIVFHAGSLSVPMKQMAEEFEKQHPNVDVKLESAGSVACARKIIDLGRECDVFASADYKVIDKLIIPQYADWNLQFAGNELALMYTEKSRMADHINKENWHEILLNKDVAYGRSDPNSDPCGYRTVLGMKLAEKYYTKKGLANSILSKDSKYIRPKEVDLIALLEVGTIDYMFIYTSIAVQHGFDYIHLPDSISLGNPARKEWYGQVSTEINGKQPGEKLLLQGEPIVYGTTILKEAPNRTAAEEFVRFICSKQGSEIMAKNGQVVISPPRSENMNIIPKKIKEVWNKEPQAPE